mmetsp:Transcript_98075/g.299817  ORF Transcript_98075/g.299817 Transcript_98075/m.299817 type:complete len:350 (-) Transcript_98075:540-1589(-)
MIVQRRRPAALDLHCLQGLPPRDDSLDLDLDGAVEHLAAGLPQGPLPMGQQQVGVGLPDPAQLGPPPLDLAHPGAIVCDDAPEIGRLFVEGVVLQEGDDQRLRNVAPADLHVPRVSRKALAEADHVTVQPPLAHLIQGAGHVGLNDPRRHHLLDHHLSDLAGLLHPLAKLNAKTAHDKPAQPFLPARLQQSQALLLHLFQRPGALTVVVPRKPRRPPQLERLVLRFPARGVAVLPIELQQGAQFQLAELRMRRRIVEGSHVPRGDARLALSRFQLRKVEFVELRLELPPLHRVPQLRETGGHTLRLPEAFGLADGYGIHAGQQLALASARGGLQRDVQVAATRAGVTIG